MGLLDRRTASALFTILVFLSVIGLVWTARRPVISFIFAIFFAYLLEPVVNRFAGWLKLSVGKAVAVTYLAILIALLIFGFTVAPRVMQQGQRLSQALPELFEKVQSGTIVWQLGAQQGWSYQTQVLVQQWLVGHREDISNYARDVADRVEQAGANMPWILLVPVLAVFFLKDGTQLRSSVIKLIGASSNRAFIRSVLDDLDTMLGQYVRAQLLLAFFAFIAYGTFFLIARVPYAMAIAAIGGTLEFIPFAGPLITLVILMGLAFLTGYQHWLVLLVFWLVWRGIQDYVNTPRLMGAELDLHPLLAIFAILVGGEVGGVTGIYLSIPAVAALRILWLNWTRRAPSRKAA